MNPLQWLTAIAYAISKGVAEAWFDTIAQRSTQVEELPNAEDRARAARLHDAIAGAERLLDAPPDNHPAGSDGAAPGGGGDQRAN